MKLYIASSWLMKDDMPQFAREFEQAGHEITFKWWEVPDSEANSTQALNDLNGVLDADAMILLNTAKSEGKATEQGIAIASGIPIVAVGTQEQAWETSKNIFQWLVDVYEWCPTVHDALNYLQSDYFKDREQREWAK